VKKRKSSNKSPARSKSSAAGRNAESSGVRSLISAAALVVVVVLCVVGLERLKDHVYTLPAGNVELRVELADTPDWVDSEKWGPRILSALELPDDISLNDDRLVRLVADQMADSGWVSKVNRVAQDMDGTIRVHCEYRRPIAMVHDEGLYVPVDKDGVRLPEVYGRVAEDSGWMRVYGIRGRLPDVGEAFTADDAVSAVSLASLIFDCGPKFSGRICSIDVANFRGRRDKHENHIVLRTHGGGMIEWGSAIGEEIEEPTAMEKIRNIAVYFGTRSAPRHIDVSIYGNAWIEPAGASERIIQGSRS